MARTTRDRYLLEDLVPALTAKARQWLADLDADRP